MLTRKVSLRDSFLRKLKSKGIRTLWKGRGKFQTRRPLKKVSKSMRHKMQAYYAVRDEFLRRNPLCEICARRRGAGENIQQNASSEVHHRAGRHGKLLCDESHFIASCFPCRLWPHENPRQARALGLLA